jgi:SAM-dependent methyltransferase
VTAPTLEELFDRGTGERCSKWRHYFEIYERYLARFRGTECSYLEIGVAKGGSLDLFQEYLGDRARIVGVDMNPDCKRHARDGIEVLIGDQADPAFMNGAVAPKGPFDIIIDDGGHIPDQQLVSFFALFPQLKEGGIYLVEDLHTTFWLGGQASRFGINFYDFARGLTEKLTLYHVDQRLMERYQTPREQRTGGVSFQNFAASDIFGIHFYDSVIVFEKRKRLEPLSELR